MKKVLALVLIGIAGLVFSDDLTAGRDATFIAEIGTDPATNYMAWAVTTVGTDAPSTNAAVWKISRVVTDSNGAILSLKNAYGSGYDPLWSTAWTNRVAATYK